MCVLFRHQEKSELRVTSHGKEGEWWNRHLGSSRFCCAFFPLDPAVHITEENLPHKYNYMLSLMSPSGESQNAGVILGIPNT